MRWEEPVGDLHGLRGFRDDDHIKKAAKNLGFGIYSSMYTWVTKVVREKGIDRLMEILPIARETQPHLPHPKEFELYDLDNGPPRPPIP